MASNEEGVCGAFRQVGRARRSARFMRSSNRTQEDIEPE